MPRFWNFLLTHVQHSKIVLMKWKRRCIVEVSVCLSQQCVCVCQSCRCLNEIWLCIYVTKQLTKIGSDIVIPLPQPFKTYHLLPFQSKWWYQHFHLQKCTCLLVLWYGITALLQLKMTWSTHTHVTLNSNVMDCTIVTPLGLLELLFLVYVYSPINLIFSFMLFTNCQHSEKAIYAQHAHSNIKYKASTLHLYKGQYSSTWQKI